MYTGPFHCLGLHPLFAVGHSLPLSPGRCGAHDSGRSGQFQLLALQTCRGVASCLSDPFSRFLCSALFHRKLGQTSGEVGSMQAVKDVWNLGAMEDLDTVFVPLFRGHLGCISSRPLSPGPVCPSWSQHSVGVPQFNLPLFWVLGAPFRPLAPRRLEFALVANLWMVSLSSIGFSTPPSTSV